MSDWIEWNGGECPVPGDTRVDVRLRGGVEYCGYTAREWDWSGICGVQIVAYRIAKEEPQTLNKPETVKGYEGYNESGGGKLSGDHYYRVNVFSPISPELSSYSAECADIIEALNMTFNEGEAFKALWRLAASRQGRVKDGSKGMQYDADKVAHYGARVAAQTALQMKDAKK